MFIDIRVHAYRKSLPFVCRFCTVEFQDCLLFGTDIVSFEMPLSMVDIFLEWRNTKKISEEAFNKVARENAVKLLNL